MKLLTGAIRPQTRGEKCKCGPTYDFTHIDGDVEISSRSIREIGRVHKGARSGFEGGCRVGDGMVLL